MLYILLLLSHFYSHLNHFTGDPIAKAKYTLKTSAAGGLYITLDGSASSDPDGFIAKYEWTQIGDTPNTAHIYSPNLAITTVAPSVWLLGVYKFQLTVTDNLGGTNSTIVTISVVNGQSS